MHEQIAGNTGAIIPVIPPPEEPKRIEIPFCSVSYISIPVYRGKRCILRNGILPGASRRIPCPKSLSIVELSNSSRFKQFLSFFVAKRTHPLASNLKDLLCFVLSFNNFITFIY